jgi:PAS domain S-box-containing protein
MTELQKTERRFDAVFQDPNLLVGILSPAGELRRVNGTAMEYITADRDAVLGEYFWETPWWSDEQRDDVRRWIEQAATGEYIEYQSEHVRSNGDVFTVEGTVRPVTDEGDEVVSLIVSANDITERKEQERQLERYAALTQQSTDIHTVLDESGVIKYESESVERVLGYDQRELLGECAFDYVHPEDREAVVEAFTGLIDHPVEKTTQITFRMRGAEGTWTWLESVASNRTDTVIDGYVVTSRDVTERKQRELELEHKNERLEEFARIVSHDLRNPLGVLSGGIELIERTGDTGYLAECQEAVDRMEALIDDLLTLARQGERIETKEPVALDAIAPRCWETVETEDAELSVETERTVRADPGRLRQLFENLYRNAIEHGGGDVAVTIGGLDDGFYVADDGPGIPHEQREQVLRSGFSTTSEGTGLGLAIVSDIVAAHGWDVDIVESETGGARFEIRTAD